MSDYLMWSHRGRVYHRAYRFGEVGNTRFTQACNGRTAHQWKWYGDPYSRAWFTVGRSHPGMPPCSRCFPDAEVAA